MSPMTEILSSDSQFRFSFQILISDNWTFLDKFLSSFPHLLVDLTLHFSPLSPSVSLGPPACRLLPLLNRHRKEERPKRNGFKKRATKIGVDPEWSRPSWGERPRLFAPREGQDRILIVRDPRHIPIAPPSHTLPRKNNYILLTIDLNNWWIIVHWILVNIWYK